MQHLGLEGYDHLVDVVLTNCDRMRAAVSAIDGLRVLGAPIAQLFAIAGDETAAAPVPIMPLATAMRDRGWVHDIQTRPDSLHTTVSNVNTRAVDRYPDDLAAAVADVRAGKYG